MDVRAAPITQSKCMENQVMMIKKERAMAALLMRKKDLIMSTHHHHQQSSKYSRFLITVDVVGSTGPIRFIVNEDELVNTVIHTTLKSYAREDRRPVLGFDATNFLLYCANAEFKALGPTEAIGSCEGRKFVLSKKQHEPVDDHTKENYLWSSTTSLKALKDAKKKYQVRKIRASWRAWLNKSLITTNLTS